MSPLDTGKQYEVTQVTETADVLANMKKEQKNITNDMLQEQQEVLHQKESAVNSFGEYLEMVLSDEEVVALTGGDASLQDRLYDHYNILQEQQAIQGTPTGVEGVAKVFLTLRSLRKKVFGDTKDAAELGIDGYFNEFEQGGPIDTSSAFIAFVQTTYPAINIPVGSTYSGYQSFHRGTKQKNTWNDLSTYEQLSLVMKWKVKQAETNKEGTQETKDARDCERKKQQYVQIQQKAKEIEKQEGLSDEQKQKLKDGNFVLTESEKKVLMGIQKIDLTNKTLAEVDQLLDDARKEGSSYRNILDKYNACFNIEKDQQYEKVDENSGQKVKYETPDFETLSPQRQAIVRMVYEFGKKGERGKHCRDWASKVYTQAGLGQPSWFYPGGKTYYEKNPPISKRKDRQNEHTKDRQQYFAEHAAIFSQIKPGDRLFLHNGNTADKNANHSVIFLGWEGDPSKGIAKTASLPNGSKSPPSVPETRNLIDQPIVHIGKPA